MRTCLLFITAFIVLAACAMSGESPDDRSAAGGINVAAAPSTTATTVTVVTSSSASSTTSSTTTSSTTTTTTIVLSPDEAVALADAFYEAANRGDVEGASELARLSQARRTAITSLDARFWWRCESGDGHTVRCQETIRDSFYGPAGLYHEATIEFEVDNGRLASTTVDCLAEEPGGALLEFVLAFDGWLRETYPGNREWRWLPDRSDPHFELGVPCGRYLGLDPAAAESVAKRVGEFVEASASYPIRIVLESEGSTLTGSRLGRTLLEVERDTSAWSEMELTRQPSGTLSGLGWSGTVWQVHELVPGSERRAGRYLQVEIHRLWPEIDADVLWLTDYSGVTRNQLTGYPPDERQHFNLLDALTLRGPLDRFGLHMDCRVNGDIVAALISFEGKEPQILVGWAVDIDTRRLVEIDDPGQVEFGDCFAPRPRE